MTDPRVRTLRTGFRCTCHHPSRRCFYQCSNSTVVVRPSDARPVCSFCISCDPSDSAGYRVEDYHFEEVPA